MFALDCQGVDLRAAAGRLALVQLAFRNETGIHCFLFDYVQLGETVKALNPFLSNSCYKIVHDTQTYATMFAHKYGVKLQGVIDAQWGYETLTNKSLYCQTDILEWCAVAPPGWHDECTKMEQNEMWWLNRPLAQTAMKFAVQGVCSLYATSPPPQLAFASTQQAQLRMALGSANKAVESAESALASMARRKLADRPALAATLDEDRMDGGISEPTGCRPSSGRLKRT
ncbi:unnamed protein product [Prorocentrum cordatum]|uniref:3'-5' exonuclease domain-containing protein n=1 Tax=Prorocentrum cordatum TaxID=2364126 RepID=A0ABN9U4C5_9DINO|nr:unnamed protein product [Polarella glacialis]